MSSNVTSVKWLDLACLRKSCWYLIAININCSFDQFFSGIIFMWSNTNLDMPLTTFDSRGRCTVYAFVHSLMTLDSSATNENHSYDSQHNRVSNKCDAISNFRAHDRLWGWGGSILINKLPVTLKWRQLFTSQHYISTEGCTSTTSHNRHPLSDNFSRPWFSEHHTMHWL